MAKWLWLQSDWQTYNQQVLAAARQVLIAVAEKDE